MKLQEKYLKYVKLKQSICIHPEDRIKENDYGPGGGIEYQCLDCGLIEDGE